MTTWIAFLRAINVGGKNLLPMKDLSRIFADTDCDNVRTYIQSGNIVFNSRVKTRDKLVDRVATKIEKHHGFRPPILILRLDELRAAADLNPFPEATSEPKSLHLFFLEKVPARSDLSSLSKLKSASESYSLRQKTLYLHAPDGIARSRFAKGAETALQVSTTARNWRTVAKVIELASEIE